MANRRRCSLVAAVALTLAGSSVEVAYAGVISTQQYIGSMDREAAIARIDSVLARDEVKSELERLGVDPAAATERVAALSDDELQQLATNLDDVPAGGSLLAVVGVVFIVLLILELVGVIDIFKKI